MVCLYWGANTDNMTIKNFRIRDTFTDDGINMTNGSTDNHVVNNDARPRVTDGSRLYFGDQRHRGRRRTEKNNLYEA